MKKIGYIFIVLFFLLFFLIKNHFNEKQEIDNIDSNNKITLKLMHDDTIDLTYQETEAVVETKKVNNIRFNLIEENEYRFFDKKRDYNNLKIILEYIQNNFGIEINNKWKYQISIISTDYGMIRFVYYINEEIGTNKAITFEINNGIVDNVYYSYIYEYTDEDEIIKKVENFKKNTIQEKKELDDNEKLIEEKITYNYNYRIGKVIYTYCLFFQNENGSIDNNYGSTYFVE